MQWLFFSPFGRREGDIHIWVVILRFFFLTSSLLHSSPRDWRMIWIGAIVGTASIRNWEAGQMLSGICSSITDSPCWEAVLTFLLPGSLLQASGQPYVVSKSPISLFFFKSWRFLSWCLQPKEKKWSLQGVRKSLRSNTTQNIGMSVLCGGTSGGCVVRSFAKEEGRAMDAPYVSWRGIWGEAAIWRGLLICSNC